MEDKINVFINGVEHTVLKSDTLLKISEKFKSTLNNDILLALVDNEVLELSKTANENAQISFLDITNPHGYRAYQRSTVFIMLYAIKEILGKKTRVVVEHSINKNYYCEIPDQNIEITEELLENVEEVMKDVIEKDIAFQKYSLPIDEAEKISKEFNMLDKVENLKFRRTSNVNFYKLNSFYNYFYGPMAPSAGYVKKFKLHKSQDGFILQFPAILDPEVFSEIKPLRKISQVFIESSRWANILGLDTVGGLNNIICKDGIGNIIRISEALHEKKIAELADKICSESKSIVLIAGPSSSGKTTFANRLCIQLRVNGKRPFVISLDDYYVNRDFTPKDEWGNPDYECLEAIDVKQINHDLTMLLKGETVDIPHFNFVSGKREYKNRFYKMLEGDILVIEGIHGLNEKISQDIPKKDKFKIFISALAQLNLDDNNHIPTTDTRLIRRIVRDNRFRGISALTTFDVWPSVLRGENKYIFPFQEEADALFNSALVYEMCILKQYVDALLFAIPKDVSQYSEAKRLIKFLDSFLGVSSELVPPNSILREFVGGSCFNT